MVTGGPGGEEWQEGTWQQNLGADHRLECRAVGEGQEKWGEGEC